MSAASGVAVVCDRVGVDADVVFLSFGMAVEAFFIRDAVPGTPVEDDSFF